MASMRLVHEQVMKCIYLSDALQSSTAQDMHIFNVLSAIKHAKVDAMRYGKSTTPWRVCLASYIDPFRFRSTARIAFSMVHARCRVKVALRHTSLA